MTVLSSFLYTKPRSCHFMSLRDWERLGKTEDLLLDTGEGQGGGEGRVERGGRREEGEPDLPDEQSIVYCVPAQVRSDPAVP